MPSPRPEPPTGSATGQLHGVLEPIVAAAGFDLERLDVRTAGRRHSVTLVVDSDDGVGLDDIALVSRAASDELDRHEHLIGGSYTLEVTSPGVDRPLTGLRHWRRAHLRQVAVRTRDGADLHRPGRAGRGGGGHPAGGRPAARAALRRRRARRGPGGVPPGAGGRAGAVAGAGRGLMNVDIAALRTIEREKDIPFETVLEAIETALLTAYRHTDGHQPHARIDIDRKTGAVRVLAQELAADGAVQSPSGTTPRRASAGSPPPPRGRSSCSGCATPSTSAPTASSPAKEGEIVAGVVQRDARANARGVVIVALSGQTEGVLPQAEQVPGETLRSTASGSAATSSACPGECAAPRSR